MKTYSSHLVASGQHHYGVDILLPDHSPEFIHCDGQRTLSGYKLFSWIIALFQKKEKKERKKSEKHA